MYDVDYFIKKFEAIPERDWCTMYLKNRHDQSCALGHCGMKNEYQRFTTEATALFNLVFSTLGHYVADINDGEDPRYQQPTPKQRILAALYDIKKMSIGQEAEVCDATKMPNEPEDGAKIIHHYHAVTVPQSLSEQAEKLITNS